MRADVYELESAREAHQKEPTEARGHCLMEVHNMRADDSTQTPPTVRLPLVLCSVMEFEAVGAQTMNDLIPYIIGAVLALMGAGGLRWLLDRLSGPEPDNEESSSISPAPKPIEDPDDRQTPKPARPDPARLPDDDPDALEQLSSWGDELLDE